MTTEGGKTPRTKTKKTKTQAKACNNIFGRGRSLRRTNYYFITFYSLGRTGD